VNSRRIRGIYRRHYYGLLHSPPGWFDLFYWPVIDLLLWGLVTLFVLKRDIDLPLPVEFLLGGVLLWDILFRSGNQIGISFLDDTSWTHNILNLLVSPLRTGEYLTGIVLFSLTKLAVGWVVMVALAWGLFSFFLLDVGLVLAVFVLALMFFGIALSMLVVGLCLRFGPGADILAWGLMFLMLPISAIYYPVDVLPEWAQWIALALPSAHIFESMRAVLAGQPAPWGSLGAAFALDALYLALGLLFAGKMFRTLKRRGYVTRYM
jgi:ABC-2 type transport system permease protein